MSSNKDKALKKISDDFNSMSVLTLKQMKLLSKVLASEKSNVSENTLNQMIENENRLDDFEVKISKRITNAIVLYHPVASELRNIMACYRMLTNLERIGDLVMKTVKTITKNNETEMLLNNVKSINKLLSISTKMVSKAVASFLFHDIDAAMWTIKNDSAVDTMNQKIVNNLMDEIEIKNVPHQLIIDFMAVKSILSSIERMADHAAHIGEASIYAYDGEEVRHTDITEKED